MKKHELLVPAGNMESLKQAIFNGADAVYLGCKSFGARKFAKNFDNNEIIEAIKLAHLYDVKIYVTMNTLIKDDDVDTFLTQIEFLHKNGVDAVIIQDFGMLCLIREQYPNLEVHASTQANTSSKATAQLFYNLGVKRVVFSREMTLEEINNIDVPIEKEVFIHGALCVSYSGCCLMSSMLGTRSGNKGECAGSCRLPYSLEKSNQIIESNKYLLSTKELNTSSKIKELLESDITSFKIEGRMKSPEYVGFITRYYRNLIDNNMNNLDEETEKLKTIFNREFTCGNLFNVSPPELMNKKTPNHIGLEIGRVIEVTKTKIKIKLNKPLNQQDGIRFLNSGKGFIVNFMYDAQDNLINSATDICYVDNKVNLSELDIVFKTQDYQLLNSLSILPERKIPISYEVVAQIEKPLTVTITDEENKLTVYGDIVKKSINSPVSAARIREQLGKLGTTPFKLDNFTIINNEEIFISIKELNEIRRYLVEKLIEIRSNKKVDFKKQTVNFNKLTYSEKNGITAQVFTEEQLKTCVDLKLTRIYIENLDLYNKYSHNNNVYYKLPRCTRNPLLIEKNRNLISDYYEVNKNNKYVADYPMNITNIYTLYYLEKQKISIKTLSVELTDYDIQNMILKYQEKFNAYPNIEILIYGRVENMLIKGNILSLNENEYNTKLVDFKKRKFPVYYDGENTHILNYENKIIEDISLLKNKASIRFNFFDENKSAILDIIKPYL